MKFNVGGALCAAMLCLPLAAAAAWSPDLWPLATHTNVDVYTNTLANDLVSNVLARTRSLQDTNWNETNSIPLLAGYTNSVESRSFTNGTNIVSRTFTNAWPLLTNVVFTNVYGPVVTAGGLTGAVPVQAESLERLTDQIEALLPSYSLPYYTTGADWSFDWWFSHPTNLYLGPNQYEFGCAPQDFPYASKADLFHKAGLGGLLVYGKYVVTSLDDPTYSFTNDRLPYLTFSNNLAQATNYLGQVTTNAAGFWSKRKNRHNDLILAIWGPESAWLYDSPWGGWLNPWIADFPELSCNTYPTLTEGIVDGSAINPTEYLADPGYRNIQEWGDSRLIDLLATNYPQYIWVPGHTNDAFPANLRVKAVFGNWLISPELSLIVSNTPVGQYALWRRSMDNLLQNLSAVTTRSDYAFAQTTILQAYGDIPIHVHTNYSITNGIVATNIWSNACGHLVLKYTDPVRTYEGTKVWDSVMLPEQLDEHHVALTNMFLTPWAAWHWTNTMWTSNTWAASITDLVTEAYLPVTNGLFDDYYTNAIYSNAACLVSGTGLPENIPWWLPVEMLPWYRITVPPWDATAIGWVPVTNAVAPSFTYFMDLTASINERFEGSTTFFPTSSVPSNAVWNWHAFREGNADWMSAYGQAWKSRVAVTNLYTGVPHRMHVYARYNFGRNGNTSPYFHRVEIVPAEGYTTNAALVSSHIDVSTNIAGFDLIPATNALTEGCGADFIGTESDEYLATEPGAVAAYTQALTWATNVLTETYSNTVYEDSHLIIRNMLYYTNIVLTSQWTEVATTNADLTWEIYVHQVSVPVPVIWFNGFTETWETNWEDRVYSCPTNYEMVSDCVDIGTNIAANVTNWWSDDPNSTSTTEFDIGDVHYVYYNFNWVITNWYGSTGPVSTACITYPDTIDLGNVYQWEGWWSWFYWNDWPTLAGSQLMKGIIDCVFGIYNHATASAGGASTVNLETNVTHGVDVRVLIEWQH